MKMYSYIVRYDVGFAPNPFHGTCSLATCKQDIRKKASVGDWILGTGSAENAKAGDLVFAMHISEILTFDQYWNDPRFLEKRPNLRGSRMRRFGDNIYHTDSDGEWVQSNSRHSRTDGSPEERHIERDTKSRRVLLAEEFYYYGGVGPTVPNYLREDYELDIVHTGPAYRCNFPATQVSAAINWLRTLESGMQGRPQDWPSE